MTIPTFVNTRAPIPVQADRMARLEDRMVRLQAQIATGERFTEAAEAPPEALRAAGLDRLQNRLDSDQRAIARATTRLSYADTALDNAASTLIRATELALAAANGTTGPDDRIIYLAELRVLREQLLDSANARDEAGRHIFAGATQGRPAYAPDPDGVIRFQGLGTAAGAEPAGIGTAVVPTGPSLFGAEGADAFAAVDGLIAALETADPLERGAGLDMAISGLEVATNRIGTGRALIGAAMARLETEELRIEAARLDTAEAQAATTGLDLTAAIAQLAALELTLNAARASFTRIFESTLFDRLG